MDCTVEGNQMQIHIACSLLNSNDLCNNLSSRISSVSKISICVTQAKKRTSDSYTIVLVVQNEDARYYFSSALHFKWQPKKARLFRSGRRPHRRVPLPSNHLEAERTGGKKGEQSMHTILHLYTFPALKSACLSSVFLLGEVCKAVI